MLATVTPSENGSRAAQGKTLTNSTVATTLVGAIPRCHHQTVPRPLLTLISARRNDRKLCQDQHERSLARLYHHGRLDAGRRAGYARLRTSRQGSPRKPGGGAGAGGGKCASALWGRSLNEGPELFREFHGGTIGRARVPTMGRHSLAADALEATLDPR